MEGIVRMTTELGVTPDSLFTERTVVRLPPDRWAARLARWQRVAREAAQQSGRAAVPEITARTRSTWRPDPSRMAPDHLEEEPADEAPSRRPCSARR
jgi:16S rRNA (uracil1498-N3)-methyltransferase